MRNNISLYTACSLVFLALLMLSGSIPGGFSEVLYFLAFIIPIALGLKLAKPRPPSDSGETYQPPLSSYFGFSKRAFELTAPVAFVAVAVIFLLSFLTSLAVTALTGVENTVDVGESLPLAILMHVLLPSVLEEGMFRLLPMYMLSGYSRRVTIFISSMYFALVHNSFFSMPYAFVAGVIFVTLDLMTESVWPSVVLHFINNLLSVLWIFYGERPTFAWGFVVALSVLATLGAVVIFIRRGEYKMALRGMFSLDEKYVPSYEPLMLIIPTLISATAVLF